MRFLSKKKEKKNKKYERDFFQKKKKNRSMNGIKVTLRLWAYMCVTACLTSRSGMGGVTRLLIEGPLRAALSIHAFFLFICFYKTSPLLSPHQLKYRTLNFLVILWQNHSKDGFHKSLIFFFFSFGSSMEI